MPAGIAGQVVEVGWPGAVMHSLKCATVVTPARHCWTRVPFFTKWINSLCMDDPGWSMVDEDNFFEELKSGLVLCKVVERLVPGADLTTKGIYHKPRTRATCVANIDKALTVAWRTGVNAGHMCSADDIYDCKITAVTRCVSELFDALQMRLREVRSRSRDMLTSMNAHLIPIGCGLSERTLNDPVQHCDALVADFADCTKIIALLVSTGKASVEDLLSLAHREQTSGAEGAQLKGLLQENGRILSELLEANGCPVLLGPGEFANPPSPFPDTILLQLHIIWRSVGGGAPGAAGPGQPAQSPMFHSASPGGVAGSKAELQLWMQAMSTQFTSLDDAFWSWCGNMSGRMSRSTFMQAMRELNFQGDAKLVWDTLNRGVPGFISQEDFARPELEASFAQVLQRSLQEGEGEPQEGEEERNFVGGADTAGEGDGEVVEDAAEDQWGTGADDQAAGDIESVSFLVLPLGEGADIDLAEACRLAGDEEPRLSGASEERLRMLSEDIRRQQDLQEHGATSAARLVAAAAAAAAAAASSLVSAEALQIGDSQSFPELPDVPVFSDFKKESMELGDEAMDAVSILLSELSVHELPMPTTSVDTCVVMSDGSECRAWLQTNVVDSPQESHLQQVYDPVRLTVRLSVVDVPSRVLFRIAEKSGREAVLHDTRKPNHVARLGKLLVYPRSAAVSPANCRPRRDWWDLEILRTRHGADLLQSDPQSWAIAKTVNAREGRQRPSDLRERVLLDNDVRRQTSIFSVLQKESSLPTFAAGLPGPSEGKQVHLRDNLIASASATSEPAPRSAIACLLHALLAAKT
ncbi:unnamed protein product [Symbiodinium necroappetens]|uniref:Calponin-homology (CH) domain-containing protein n=1 Tax=Symbiodinium necroappetens TaxID=1628268 RepID=A0A813A823_9DINO|nr:unnamed protein product [Symbiodinium necroappetens]